MAEEIKFSLEDLSAASHIETYVMGPEVTDTQTKSNEENEDVFVLNKNKMKALLDKNWKQFYRNIGGVLFFITFPILQLWFFANSVGTDPLNLKLGIVNNESTITLCTGFNWNETAIPYDLTECHLKNISCRFLTYIEHPMINKVLYNSVSSAVDDIKHGKIIGVLYIPSNFSKAYEERMKLGKNAKKWTIDFGEIKVYMDMSNRQTGMMLKHKLFELFIEFQKDLLADCHLSRKLAEFPYKYHFIYGNNKEPMTVFMAPGIIVLLSFLLGSTMTSQILVKEKMEGIWERSIVAGVSSLEITLAHLLFQATIMLVQCIVSIVMTFFILKIGFVGSIWVLFLLCYVCGVCGMAYGFCVSAICRTYTEANIACTGGYLPMTMLCGVIWPTEGMPSFLRVIAVFLPCTIISQSFRNVMAKGWSLWNFQVFNGVVINVIWILVFAISSVWLIKIKK